ncbi:uncharacterized protein LOC135097864 [Scylla paramamosain]|uniref:uncharacterized protein LOC135097864 n=1 Tax=Scylla paramamosain TaxID=85552 RepID=UPI003083C777
MCHSLKTKRIIQNWRQTCVGSQTDSSRIKELPVQYITGGIAIGLQKKITFRKLFDRSLQKRQESSLMNKLRSNWLSAGTSMCGRKTKFTASLSDVAAIFILLMGGAAFSCLLLLLLLLLEYAVDNDACVKPWPIF